MTISKKTHNGVKASKAHAITKLKKKKTNTNKSANTIKSTNTIKSAIKSANTHKSAN